MDSVKIRVKNTNLIVMCEALPPVAELEIILWIGRFFYRSKCYEIN